ncbi:uncharacterized protein LOC21395433 isoform X1 [Morus notabilis]|uniref:uncharacterized protein LOC21395433 isoform X1 n=1 Tax=Morus notabilis TaxID=981085 RepID=UPI000CECE56B|nr:uncharacterized protein LOC21395433 isoform X1 [Morus notabilis]
MSISLNLAGLPCSSSSHLDNNKSFFLLRASGLSFQFRSLKPKISSLNHSQFRRFFSVNGDHIDVHGFSDAKSCSPQDEDPVEKSAGGQGVLPKSKELVEKLRRYGIAGLLSYGLLNTVYYLTTFLLVWFYVAPAPGKMGYLAAVERFLKIMAMVWAGSQVTKIARAGGALALAPFVDRGLSWFTVKYKFESQGKAFMAIVAFCLGLAILLFFFVTLLWA